MPLSMSKGMTNLQVDKYTFGERGSLEAPLRNEKMDMSMIAFFFFDGLIGNQAYTADAKQVLMAQTNVR